MARVGCVFAVVLWNVDRGRGARNLANASFRHRDGFCDHRHRHHGRLRDLRHLPSRQRRRPGPSGGGWRTSGQLVLPISVGALTTIAAFVVMTTSPMHGYQQLGLFGAVGVLFSAAFRHHHPAPRWCRLPKQRGQPAAMAHALDGWFSQLVGQAAVSLHWCWRCWRSASWAAFGVQASAVSTAIPHAPQRHHRRHALAMTTSITQDLGRRARHDARRGAGPDGGRSAGAKRSRRRTTRA